MSPRRRHRLAVATAAVAFGLGSAAAAAVSGDAMRSDVGSGVERSPLIDVEGGQPLSYSGARTDVGEGQPWTTAIAHVMASPGMDVLRDISVIDAPEGFLDENVSWLRIQLAEPEYSGWGQARVGWLAAIAQGAVLELHNRDAKAANQVVGGAIVEVQAEDGVHEQFGGTGYVATGQLFERANSSDDELMDDLSSTLRSFGLTTSEVRVLRPLGAAVQIRVVVPNAGRPDWTIDQLRNALVGVPARIEGLYLQLEQSDGRVLLAAGTSYRTGFGSLWFAENQDQRFRANHGNNLRAAD